MSGAEILLGVVAVVLGGDKLFAALMRLGMIPRRLRGWDQRRAEQVVEAAMRSETLDSLVVQADAIVQLAEHVDCILEELRPNSGASFRDRIEGHISESAEVHDSILRSLDASKRWMDEHLAEHRQVERRRADRIAEDVNGDGGGELRR